jgi:hypothetical protein
VAKLMKLFTDPDRMNTGLHGTRDEGRSMNHFSVAFGVVRKRARSTTSPSWLSVQ